MRAALIAALCLVGCYSPHYGDCEVSCASNVCPSGLECQGGMCRVGGMTGACGNMPDAAGSGSGIPLEQLANAQRDALCNWLVRCGSMEDLATCRSALVIQFQLDQIIAGVAAGKVMYDGVKAQQCVNSFAQSSCERARSFTNGNVDPVCSQVFSGTVPSQGTCYFSEECVSQDCTRSMNCPTATCCMGTCNGGSAPTTKTAGQPCGTRDVCVDSYCPGTGNGVCTAYKGLNATCSSTTECMPGIGCLGGTCQPMHGTNSACMATSECLNLADVCLGSQCVPSGLRGTPCTGNADQCQISHACSGMGTINGQCQLYPAIGEACGIYPCREGYCNAAGVCTAKIANGNSCDPQMQYTCESGFCDASSLQCQPARFCN